MDGAWPALSKSSLKLLPLESVKNLYDSGSNSAPQGDGLASSSVVASSSLQSQLQSSLASQRPMTATGSATHDQTPSHGRPARQKSMKRDGGDNIQGNGGLYHHTLLSDGPHNHNNYVKPSSVNGYESSSRVNMQNSGNGGNHPQQCNSFRRGNSRPHSRGDGSHQGYGRDVLMQPWGSPRGYARGPPVSAPFPHPGAAAMSLFWNPMFVPDFPMLYVPPQGMPFGSPFPTAMYFPAADPQLKAKLLNQIDYYFSNENLVKDTFLRQNMDKNGWVLVELIAGFKKVAQLTDNIQLILDAIQSSSVVEAQLLWNF